MTTVAQIEMGEQFFFIAAYFRRFLYFCDKDAPGAFCGALGRAECRAGHGVNFGAGQHGGVRCVVALWNAVCGSTAECSG